MKIEIVWNDIEDTKHYNDQRFNPYINNSDYSIKLSFCDCAGNISSDIFTLIPNLKLLIAHYFNYRQKYHKKFNQLLRFHKNAMHDNMNNDEDEDQPFDAHDAIVSLKDNLGRTMHQSLNGVAKQQSYFYTQYESLSLQMFLQKLFWSIKTLNYLN